MALCCWSGTRRKLPATNLRWHGVWDRLSVVGRRMRAVFVGWELRPDPVGAEPQPTSVSAGPSEYKQVGNKLAVMGTGWGNETRLLEAPA